MPALSNATMDSTTAARAPEYPIDRLRARSSIIARTASRSTSAPSPAACERISASCSSSDRSGGMTVLASAPNPVETPYTGSGEWTSRSTTAAPRSRASRASAPIVTRRSCRATATTSAAATAAGAEHEWRVVRHGVDRTSRDQCRWTPPYFMRVSLIAAARASSSLIPASTTSPTKNVCVPKS